MLIECEQKTTSEKKRGRLDDVEAIFRTQLFSFHSHYSYL